MGNETRGFRCASIFLLALLLPPVGAAEEDAVPAEEAERPPDALRAEAAEDPEIEGLAVLPEIEADEAAFPLTAGWSAKNGFFISDPDAENFLLQIAGRLQARYTYKGVDGDTDRSSGELERLRLLFRGHVLSPNLRYTYQVDGDTDGDGAVGTVDAYIQYRAGELFGAESEAFAIGVGQWKPHFLRQEPNSSGRLQMVERSLANEFFNIDRNVGVWLQGYAAPFFYSFGVTNGFDSVNEPPDEIDQIPAFVGKLDFNLIGEERGKYSEGSVGMDEPLWVLGLSAATDENNGTQADPNQEFKAYQFGLDTIFKVNGASLQAEYMGRWLDYPGGNPINGSGSAHYAHGFYLQGGAFLVPDRVEATARVSSVWGDGPDSGNGWTIGPGLNWYVSRSHKVKLQTDVLYFDIDGDVPPQSERLYSSSPFFDSSAAGLEADEEGAMWRLQLQLQF